MSITSELKRCPKCGGPIPAEAPQGLCPKCLLLQASIPTETGKHSFSQSIPPPQEELAAAFPQLEILELIGQGGMGFVFKARQPKLERLVALKILPQSLAADPAFAERFAREGRTLARLSHPNIVTIHDFGQANGFFYLLMEFVDGVNLREAMKVGRFTPEQALAVVPKICDALQFAHNEGILHRDIKPENILLDSKGRVKIADFGIAKIVETESEVSLDLKKEVGGQTAVTGIMGTPQYMAPEQIEHPQQVDQRADIYSLGVVFYEMLTGELPVGRFAPPSEKSSADPRLDEVVLRALEKEPNRRTQSAVELRTQVETITESASSIEAPHPATLESSPPSGEKSSPFQSPFASPEFREIRTHFTNREANQFSLLELLTGVWIAAAAAIFLIPAFIRSSSSPGGWIVPSIWGIFIVFSCFLLYRMQRQFLCSTAWAKQKGFKPGQLKLFSFSRSIGWRDVAFLVGLALTVFIAIRVQRFFPFRGNIPSKHLTKPDHFVARLSQGTIELVAVTGCSNYPVSWKPDGNPTERLVYDNSFDSSGDPRPDPRYMCRKIVFKTSGTPPGASPLTIGECAPVTAWSFLGDRINGERQDGITIYGLGFPTGAAEIPHLKVGLATGPWTNSFTEEVPRNGIYNGSGFNHEGIAWKFRIQDIQEINGATKVIAYHTDKSDWQSELVLVDSDGKEWVPQGQTEMSEGLLHLSGTCNLPLAKIKTFHLRVRPYQWVEFRNVSLHLGQRTEVEIVDAIGTEKVTNSLVSSANSEGVSAIGSFHLIGAVSRFNLAIARAESLTGYPLHQIIARLAGPALQKEQWGLARSAATGPTLAPAPEEKLGEGWRPEPVESDSIWNSDNDLTIHPSSEIFECPNECQLQFALTDEAEAKEAVRQINLALAKPIDLFLGKRIKLFQVGEREAWLEIREFRAVPGKLGFIGSRDRSVGKSPVYLPATRKDSLSPSVQSAVISIPPNAELDFAVTCGDFPAPLYFETLNSEPNKSGLYWLTWYEVGAFNLPPLDGPSWEIFIHDARTARELRHLSSPKKPQRQWRWQACHYTETTNEAPGIAFERLLFYAPDPKGDQSHPRNIDVRASMTMRPKSNEASSK